LPQGNVIIDGNKLLQQLGVTRYELDQRLEAQPQQQQ
jgi:hypothetical protein